MSEQADDHRIGGAPEVLGYARSGTEKGPRITPTSGIVSFVAMIVQVPWAVVFCLYISADLNPDGFAGVILIGFMFFLPTLIGVAYGIYSVKVAGLTGRNIFGVMGLIFVLGVACLVVCGNSLGEMQLGATPKEVVEVVQFPILVFVLSILLVVVWRLASSRRRRRLPKTAGSSQ